jgi:hypothetical protein
VFFFLTLEPLFGAAFLITLRRLGGLAQHPLVAKNPAPGHGAPSEAVHELALQPSQE